MKIWANSKKPCKGRFHTFFQLLNKPLKFSQNLLKFDQSSNILANLVTLITVPLRIQQMKPVTLFQQRKIQTKMMCDKTILGNFL